MRKHIKKNNPRLYKEKKHKEIELLILLIILIIVSFNVVIHLYTGKKLIVVENNQVLCENKAKSIDDTKIVYDGMTMNELADKLNKSLNSTVKGQGYIFAKYSLQYNVDPYLAVAIMLHETGCKWTCSSLARTCNNYGGQKGKPSCNGSSYRAYETQEEGIEGYIKNLYNNYISKGLTTPQQINKRYAENQNWYKNIESYIKSIKSK